MREDVPEEEKHECKLKNLNPQRLLHICFSPSSRQGVGRDSLGFLLSGQILGFGSGVTARANRMVAEHITLLAILASLLVRPASDELGNHSFSALSPG